MKATINRDDLVKVLKRLKPLSARADEEKKEYKDAITLSAVGNEIMIAAGPGTGFVSFYLPAEISEEGLCNIQYSVLNVIKAAPDEELVLSANKRLDIHGASGFKAHLAQNTTKLPIEIMNTYALAGTVGDIILNTNVLRDLVDISESFPAYPIGNASLSFVEITMEEGKASASIQPNELGSIDSFPLDGTISAETRHYVLRTDLLKPILTFAGECTKLGELKASLGSVMISDPENPQWWGLVGQIVYTRENAR